MERTFGKKSQSEFDPTRTNLNENIYAKKGSRPPPSSRPSTSSLSILFIMGFVVASAFVASGNLLPVDPNGPKGPPTLGPYYNPADYPVQHIVMPTGQDFSAKKNLQLKTFQVDNCGENMAMLFLIDTSGSMQYVNKIGKTKEALKYFTSQMGGKSVIGMDTFSREVKEEVPIGYYGGAKKRVQQVINSLPAKGETRTREGFELVKKQLDLAVGDEIYPGYKFNLILMTDGVPEIPPSEPRTCYWQVYDANYGNMRCFAKEEDPFVPVNLPKAIKDMGVDVYVINVYSPSYKSDAWFFPHLDPFLKRIASSPTDSHYFVSTNADNLHTILGTIQKSICYNNFNGTKQ